ncbi:uncharacterized protein DKFZp434B061-like isoform X1 [Amphibalanus amphitrite]|uniref:uncharacterized protein DKFZp434B061-like isoform X1 n=1 Tax=Amphibalanus amphitrite TaxID=1232801 RepID=UPI001C908D8E|nr:uncharacterized protein DKFZp434B061-like isoform X1 [Amphibalanus amphitrite]
MKLPIPLELVMVPLWLLLASVAALPTPAAAPPDPVPTPPTVMPTPLTPIPEPPTPAPASPTPVAAPPTTPGSAAVAASAMPSATSITEPLVPSAVPTSVTRTPATSLPPASSSPPLTKTRLTSAPLTSSLGLRASPTRRPLLSDPRSAGLSNAGRSLRQTLPQTRADEQLFRRPRGTFNVNSRQLEQGLRSAAVAPSFGDLLFSDSRRAPLNLTLNRTGSANALFRREFANRRRDPVIDVTLTNNVTQAERQRRVTNVTELERNVTQVTEDGPPGTAANLTSRLQRRSLGSRVLTTNSESRARGVEIRLSFENRSPTVTTSQETHFERYREEWETFIFVYLGMIKGAAIQAVN